MGKPSFKKSMQDSKEDKANKIMKVLETTDLKLPGGKQKKKVKRNVTTTFHTSREFLRDMNSFIDEMKVKFPDLNGKTTLSRSNFFEIFLDLIKDDYKQNGNNSMIYKYLIGLNV